MRSRYLLAQVYLKWSAAELLPSTDFVEAKHSDVVFTNQSIKDYRRDLI